jgi:hypothetical protein
MGYHIAWVSPPGPDKGIDIIAHTDPLGIKGPRIKVQVKRTTEKTTIDGIRSLLALLGDGDVGLFVATGGFTRGAEDEARLRVDSGVRGTQHASRRGTPWGVKPVDNGPTSASHTADERTTPATYADGKEPA